MILTKLIERHKQLSEEVDRISKLDKLTPIEEQKLKLLKKLKLSYKDAIQENAHEKLSS
mgnify:CR=1 FL=1|tara:strand:- start:171 stop:347 length:177 start_codon:yes stop_codon:yes gene_type:complete